MSKGETAKRVMRAALVLVATFFASTSSALEISNRYRSPRNPERKVRASTQLIVLHTTEAPARSSLNKLSDRGEAHYCVTEVGRVYAIVDRDRVAFHAGRSMWKGKEDVDLFSIGIECVGYHNKSMPTVQLAAIRELVGELKRMYRIPDERVVCHSHVAYGTPNKWQKRRHRGRKRCGMLFAMSSVRRVLGLAAKPAFDPDTRAGRLTVGDDYLRRVLYCGVDTMSGTTGRAVASAKNPTKGGSWFSRLFSGEKKDASEAGGPDPATNTSPPRKTSPPTSAVAKGRNDQKARKNTAPQSIAELKSGGWELRGCVSKNNTAMKLAGTKWNSADTYYTIRDKVVSGKKVNPARIEKGMGVWVKK